MTPPLQRGVGGFNRRSTAFFGFIILFFQRVARHFLVGGEETSDKTLTSQGLEGGLKNRLGN
jgi:hypothetical protein